MSVLLRLFHISQACLSAYTLYLSSITIPKLQQYEERSKKAAQYSNTAEHQLHKTRTTQASGALTNTLSLLTSVGLTISSHSLPTWSKLLLSSINFGTCVFAHVHLHGFWRGKAKVPFINDFNDAITLTNRMATLLMAQAATWAVSALAFFVALLS